MFKEHKGLKKLKNIIHIKTSLILIAVLLASCAQEKRTVIYKTTNYIVPEDVVQEEPARPFEGSYKCVIYWDGWNGKGALMTIYADNRDDAIEQFEEKVKGRGLRDVKCSIDK